MANPYDLNNWHDRSFDMDGMSPDGRLDLFLDLANYNIDVSMAYASDADDVISRLDKWKRENKVNVIRKGDIPEDLRNDLLHVMENIAPHNSIRIRRHVFDNNFKKLQALIKNRSEPKETPKESEPKKEESKEGSLAILYNNMVTRGLLTTAEWAVVEEPLKQWDKFMSDISNAKSLDELGDKVMMDLFFMPVNVVIDALNDVSKGIDKWTAQINAKLASEKKAAEEHKPAVDPKELKDLEDAKFLLDAHTRGAHDTIAIREGVFKYLKTHEPDLWAEYEREASNPELKSKWARIFMDKLPAAMASDREFYRLVMDSPMFSPEVKSELETKVRAIESTRTDVHDDVHSEDSRTGGTPPPSEAATETPEAPAAETPAPGDGSTPPPSETATETPEAPAAETPTPGDAGTPPPSETAAETPEAPAAETPAPGDAGTPPPSEAAAETPDAPAAETPKATTTETPAPGTGPTTPPPSETAGITPDAPAAETPKATTTETPAPSTGPTTPPPSETAGIMPGVVMGATGEKPVDAPRPATEDRTPVDASPAATAPKASVTSERKTKPGTYEYFEPAAELRDGREFEKPYVLTIDKDGNRWYSMKESYIFSSWVEIPLKSEGENAHLHIDQYGHVFLVQNGRVTAERGMLAIHECDTDQSVLFTSFPVVGATKTHLDVPDLSDEERKKLDLIAKKLQFITKRVEAESLIAASQPNEDLKEEYRKKKSEISEKRHKAQEKIEQIEAEMTSGANAGSTTTLLFDNLQTIIKWKESQRDWHKAYGSGPNIPITEQLELRDNRTNHTSKISEMFGEKASGLGLFGGGHELKPKYPDIALRLFTNPNDVIQFPEGVEEYGISYGYLSDRASLSSNPQHTIQKRYADGSMERFDATPSSFVFTTWPNTKKQNTFVDYELSRDPHTGENVIQKTSVKNGQAISCRIIKSDGSWTEYPVKTIDKGTIVPDRDKVLKKGQSDDVKAQYNTFVTEAQWHMNFRRNMHYDGALANWVQVCARQGEIWRNDHLSVTPCLTEQAIYSEEADKIQRNILEKIGSPELTDAFEQLADCDKQEKEVQTWYIGDPRFESDDTIRSRAQQIDNIRAEQIPLHADLVDAKWAVDDELPAEYLTFLQKTAQEMQDVKKKGGNEKDTPTETRAETVSPAAPAEEPRVTDTVPLTAAPAENDDQIDFIEPSYEQLTQYLKDAHQSLGIETGNSEQQHFTGADKLGNGLFATVDNGQITGLTISLKADSSFPSFTHVTMTKDQNNGQLSVQCFTNRTHIFKEYSFSSEGKLVKMINGSLDEKDLSRWEFEYGPDGEIVSSKQYDAEGKLLSDDKTNDDGNDDTTVLSPGEPEADDTIVIPQEELEKAKKTYEQKQEQPAEAQTPAEQPEEQKQAEQPAPEQPKIDLKNATYEELAQYMEAMQNRWKRSMIYDAQDEQTIFSMADHMGHLVYGNSNKGQLQTICVNLTDEVLTKESNDLDGISLSRTKEGNLVVSQGLLRYGGKELSPVILHSHNTSTYNPEGKLIRTVAWRDEESDARTVTNFGPDGKPTSVEEYDADGHLITPENTDAKEQAKPEKAVEQPAPERPKIDLKNATYEELVQYMDDLQKQHDQRFGTSMFAGRVSASTIQDAAGNNVYITLDKDNKIVHASIPDNNESLSSDKKVPGVAISRTTKDGLVYASGLMKLDNGLFAVITPVELSNYDSKGVLQEKIAWHDEESDARTVTKFGPDGKPTSVQEYDVDGNLIKPENTDTKEQAKPEKAVEQPAPAAQPVTPEPQKETVAQPESVEQPAPVTQPVTPQATPSNSVTTQQIGRGKFTTDYTEHKVRENDGQPYVETFKRDFKNGIETKTQLYDNEEQHFICIDTTTRHKIECNLRGQPGHQTGILLSIGDDHGIIKHRIIDGRVVSQEQLDRYTGQKKTTRLYNRSIPLPSGLHALNIEELSADLQRQFKKLNSRTEVTRVPNQVSKWRKIFDTASLEMASFTDLIKNEELNSKQAEIANRMNRGQEQH